MTSTEDRRSASPAESELLTTSSSVSDVPNTAPKQQSSNESGTQKTDESTIIPLLGSSAEAKAPTSLEEVPLDKLATDEATDGIQMKQTLTLMNGVGIIVGIIIGEFLYVYI